MTDGKQARKEALAAALRVTEAELRIGRAIEGAATEGLVGLTPAKRRARVAERLSISRQELNLLRRALAGSVSPDERSSAGAVVRTVATRRLVTDPSAPGRAGSRSAAKPAEGAAASRKRSRPKRASLDGGRSTDSLTPRERQVRLANRLRAAGKRGVPNWWVGGE